MPLSTRRRLTRIASLAVAVGLLALVGWILRDKLQDLTLASVEEALRSLPPQRLAVAVALTALSYLALGVNDLLAVRHVGHVLPRRRIFAFSFISYALTFSLGSFVGSFAVRYRLYTRAGFSVGEVTALIAFCLLTKWLGFFSVTGLVLSLWPLPLPESLPGVQPLVHVRLIGVALLVIPCLYVVACAVWRGELRWKGVPLKLPGWRTALAQCSCSGLEWVIAGAVPYFMLPAEALSFSRALGLYLLSAVAGLLTHVPGGVGVTEGIFLAYLSPPLPGAMVLARMLAYRALYFLVPLALALVGAAVAERPFGRNLIRKKAALQREAGLPRPTGPAH